MKISVNELKSLNDKLHSKIDSYEGLCLDYYYNLKQVELDWYDSTSKKYFQTTLEDKQNDYNTLQDIVNLCKSYDFLINNYSEIGNEIEYDSSYKDQIISLLDDIIGITDKILNDYNSIGIFSYAERSMLYGQKNTVMSLLTQSKELKSKLINNMDRIDKIEEESKEKFSKIEIKPVKDKDITPFK